MQAERLVGVWLDHRKARIVELHGDEVHEQEIESTVERHTRSTGGTKVGGTPYINAMGASERHQDERRHHEVAEFYGNVMKAITGADLLGPGLAKGEFADVLRGQKGFTDRIVSIATSEKLTERQLVAQVKVIFHKPAPRRAMP